MKKHIRTFYLVIGINLASTPLFAQQNLESRLADLDKQEKYAEALALCRKNIDQPIAAYFAGEYYYHGRKGVKQDTANGEVHYLKALDRQLQLAEEGDVVAQYRAARCLEFGKKDTQEAEAWYLRAAKGGNAKAMCSFAVLARSTQSITHNETIGHFTRAAELGEPDAKAWLGAMLIEYRDKQQEGRELLLEAAEAGSPVAMARLGALYYLGAGGVEKDVEKAVKLLEAAVGKGFAMAAEPLEMVRASLPQPPPPPPWRPEGAAPGFGFPGTLAPYESSEKLQASLDKFKMTAGWFVRDPIPPEVIPPKKCPARLPWLLHSPAKSQKPVPMVIYFGGTGEAGTNLSAHFRQTAAIAKVTDPAFQERHPCYLFAPMLPSGHHYDILPYGPGRPPHLLALVSDAMYALIRTLDDPPVDTNRLYVTGLSHGGLVTHGMLAGYPGRFAAAVPTATYFSSYLIPEDGPPSNYWLFINEGDYKRKGIKEMLEKTAETVRSRGGDFRLSAYPGGGHDAWSKAWREAAAWEWLFSKTMDGTPVRDADGVRVSPAIGTVSTAPRPTCTASVPGKDGGSGPERAVDGLTPTAYVSARGLKAGDYWQAEFPEPVKGRFCLTLGRPDGSGAPTKARVNVSEDGEAWMTILALDRGKDFVVFTRSRPMRFVRILSTAPDNAREVLVVRNLTVE